MADDGEVATSDDSLLMRWFVPSAPGLSRPTRIGWQRTLLWFRWLTALWAFGLFAYEIWDRNRQATKLPVAHPVVGLLITGALIAFTAWLTVRYNADADTTVQTVPILAEIALGTVALLADVWVYGSPDHSQSLPSVWVIAAIVNVAMIAGQRSAVLTGIGLGLARNVGWFPYKTDGIWSLTRIATLVLLAVTGWIAGYVMQRMGEADREITAFKAREEVARTLHDGVLQTLAVIQRRSDDTELVGLARTQEHELREYLFGGSTVDEDIATALRAAARRAEQRDGIRVEVITAPDLPAGAPDVIHALGGAVGEALTNAVKHGAAAKATVYAEPAFDGDHDDAVFVSVKDDGSGFDESAVVEGEGLTRSIRGRMIEVGGRVEVDGRPGRGAEVRLYV